MNATSARRKTGSPVPADRLTQADKEVLGHLATLPFLPARVLSELLGQANPSWLTRRLGALEQRGLVRAVRVPSGDGRGGRPRALWQLTREGRALLDPFDRPRTTGRLPRQWPLLVATYEVLGALASSFSLQGQGVELQAWEAPWRRALATPSGVRALELPAAARLAWSGGRTRRLDVLLLPDLGWTPVALHRRTLASLVALRAAWGAEAFPTLVVATTAAPGRADAWRELLRRVAMVRSEPPLPSLVVTWPDLRRRQLGLAWASGNGTGPSAQARGVLEGTLAISPSGSYVRAGDGVEQGLLQLLARHPFLPLAHLSGLLEIRVRDARVRLERLAAAGLVRWVGRPGDPERLPPGLAPHELAALELSELTREGLRELAASLGLSLARAERLHGLAGGGPEHPTPARRALVRALAHTLGADAVFVALHLTARGTRGGGLVRWDNAAACTRGCCRPDGYGVCRLGNRDIGFFLEYDRGTERARDYAGKWAAYYAYRDSGRAAADYASFPTILVVTAGSEEPVVRSARAAAAGRVPLPILVTTTGWVAGHPQGLLGPIWCTPESPRRRSLGAGISWHAGVPAAAATASRWLHRMPNSQGATMTSSPPIQQTAFSEAQSRTDHGVRTAGGWETTMTPQADNRVLMGTATPARTEMRGPANAVPAEPRKESS